MKVKDLKIGMILRPANDNQVFRTVYSEEWLHVVNKHRSPRRLDYRLLKENKASFAMYLGTKDDLGDVTTKWSDKFVLFENRILPVDPSAWRYIEEVK